MHYRQAGYNQKSPQAGRLYGRLVALHAAEAAFQTPHEDETLGRALRHPKRRECGGALGTRELPERLRFQDLAVKRKFNWNLIEGQTQGHPALANQNKSFLSNCVYRHWAPATRRRSSTRQASASLLWSRETVKEQRFNSYPEVTLYKNTVRLRPPRRAPRGKPTSKGKVTDVLDTVQAMG